MAHTRRYDEAAGPFGAPATVIASSDRMRGLLEEMRSTETEREDEYERVTSEVDAAVFRALLEEEQARSVEASPPEPPVLEAAPPTATFDEPWSLVRSPVPPPIAHVPTAPSGVWWIHHALVAAVIVVYLFVLLTLI